MGTPTYFDRKATDLHAALHLEQINASEKLLCPHVYRVVNIFSVVQLCLS